jgi:starch synthase
VRILFVSSEVAPLAKAGGLADVAGALPRALRAMGHDVRVVMPAYDVVDLAGATAVPGDPPHLPVEVGRRTFQAGVRRVDLGSVPISLVDVPSLYRRGGIYTDDPDEHLRFAVLQRAALALCLAWRWMPHVIHCNDWETALIPLYLRTAYRHQPAFDGTRTVLTIHNLGYQGNFGAGAVQDVGLDWDTDLLHQEHLDEGWMGFLETGIIHADALTTVSPTYAREILTPEHGAGLDGLLRTRAEDLVGILNGIDTEVWDPATDQHLAHTYSSRSLWRKEWAKRDLLEGLGMTYEKGIPVFGVVSRLVRQKGIGLLPGPVAGLLETTPARFVALGSGEPDLEAALSQLVEAYPDRARFVDGYDEALSHRIEAGSDVFLMPSLYEPCGLNQMYSLAYGTAPLVRRTGGLADTVAPWDPDSGSGTGFLFDRPDETSLWQAMTEAMEARADPRGWKRLQLNGMAEDNSWDDRAGQYDALYRRLASPAVPGQEGSDTRR